MSNTVLVIGKFKVLASELAVLIGNFGGAVGRLAEKKVSSHREGH